MCGIVHSTLEGSSVFLVAMILYNILYNAEGVEGILYFKETALVYQIQVENAGLQVHQILKQFL